MAVILRLLCLSDCREDFISPESQWVVDMVEKEDWLGGTQAKETFRSYNVFLRNCVRSSPN